MAKAVVSDIDFEGSSTCLDPTLPLEIVNLQTLELKVSEFLQFPFWDSTDSVSCIPTSSGLFPFWDSTDTSSDIALGCI